jgi:ketosteroid isomerase-like protein
MLDNTFADRFAAEWIGAWNSHDLDRILSHYTEDFELSSGVITKIVGESSGILQGKERIRAYWAKALQLLPDLHFELITTLVGVNSIVLYYQGVSGLSAEVFHFNQEEKVSRSYAHYVQNPDV